MHYDLIAGNNTNFSSSALDWSVKWRHEFKNAYFEFKPHLGWTFFCSLKYYPFAEYIGMDLDFLETENNFGTGGDLKLFFTIQTQKYGKITLGLCNYLLYIIPWNKPDSQGVEFLNLSFLEYSYPLTKNVSLVVGNSFYLKSGDSQRKTNIVSIANRIILAVQWTFSDKGAL
jgi:hypothetical protein